MNIIDGRTINQEIGNSLRKEIELKKIQPKLGILCVGEDRASLSFINVKKKFGEKYGFVVNIYRMDESVSKDDVISKIKEIEQENEGVIVQLPLPEKFKDDTKEIVDAINVKKDVDNLTGKNFFESPIVLSLKKVLPSSFGKIAIVGMGKVVGIPVKEYCERMHIPYVEVNKNEYEKILEADVVVSGVGIPHLIKAEHVKEGSTLIDYGCSYDGNELFGDFDVGTYAKARSYTPVPGGMGPIVVSCLFENVLHSV